MTVDFPAPVLERNKSLMWGTPRMKARLRNAGKVLLARALCVILAFQLVSCGTLLYPERRGQTSGRLDPAVVLMDTIGLFFFVIPGVIAFAVDIYTGCIYLPGGHSDRGVTDRLKQMLGGNTKTAIDGLLVIQTDPRALDLRVIAAIVSEETGHVIRPDDPRLIVKKAAEGAEMTRALRRLNAMDEARLLDELMNNEVFDLGRTHPGVGPVEGGFFRKIFSSRDEAGFFRLIQNGQFVLKRTPKLPA